MTRADKRMDPIHFGSDPAGIRILINPDLNLRSDFGLFYIYGQDQNLIRDSYPD